MDFDKILTKLGEFGLYQKLILAALCIPASLPCCFSYFNSLFIAASPNHWCKVPELDGFDLETRLNFSIPWELRDGIRQRSQCQMYDVNYTQLLTQGTLFGHNQSSWPLAKCRDGWNFDLTDYHRTLVTDMEVVCDKAWIIGLSETAMFAGGLVGNMFFGWLSDKIGRRKAFVFLVITNVTFGVISSFPPNFLFYVILRGLIGMTFIPLYQIPFVLALELSGPEWRVRISMLMGLTFPLGMMFLSLLAWLIKDWFILSMISYVPSILLVSYWWILPESPRWLISRKKMEEAEMIVQRIARVNKKKIPPNLLQMEIKEMNTTLEDLKIEIPSLWDLFRFPNLRFKLIIVNFSWVMNAVVYIGLSYSAASFGFNDYLAFAISAVSEIPGLLMAWFIMDRIGRRLSLFLCMLLTAVCCISTAFVSIENVTAMMVLKNIGKLGISASFSIAYMFGGELFPTCMRSMALSSGSITSGIALMVMRQVFRLMEGYHRVLPIIVMGVFSFLGGLIGSFLPETLGTHLPQTIEEGEKFGKDFKYWSFPFLKKDEKTVHPKELILRTKDH